MYVYVDVTPIPPHHPYPARGTLIVILSGLPVGRVTVLAFLWPGARRGNVSAVKVNSPGT